MRVRTKRDAGPETSSPGKDAELTARTLVLTRQRKVQPSKRRPKIGWKTAFVRYFRRIVYSCRLGRTLRHTFAFAAVLLLAPVSVTAATPAAPANAIVLRAVRHPGSAATDVFGQAPPLTTVVVTLYADLSADIPRVYIRSQTVQADADGQFSVTLSDSPVAFPTATFEVTASSPLHGITPAMARVQSTPPTPAYHTPVDQTPPDYRPH